MAPELPDHVTVALLFNVRNARTTLAEVKFMPASAFVVAFGPAKQPDWLTEEHMVPPAQLSGVVKSITPGAAPPTIPVVRLTVVAEITSVPIPKSMIAPLKFTMPGPVMAPLCWNNPPAKLRVPPAFVEYVPGHPEAQLPPPDIDNVPLDAMTWFLLLKGTLMVETAAPPVFSNVPLLLNATAAPPPNPIDASTV